MTGPSENPGGFDPSMSVTVYGSDEIHLATQAEMHMQCGTTMRQLVASGIAPIHHRRRSTLGHLVGSPRLARIHYLAGPSA